MPKLTVHNTVLRNPKWSKATAKTGDEVDLEVEAPNLKPDQRIEFRIRQGDLLIDTIEAAQGATSVKWKLLNLVAASELKFDALLRATPSPANGQISVLAKETSPALKVQQIRLQFGASDSVFVPKKEKLQINVNVTDPGKAGAKGRIEIWGERYPSDKPLYTENFNPKAGKNEWHTWDGKANDGVLNGKYISPEFTPYRVRVIVGLDQGSVDDPYGAGLGKVAMAERLFEVTFLSVRVRLMANLTGTAKTALDKMLAVEPQAAKGKYREMGRLPLETEEELTAGWQPGEGDVAKGPGTGRIRIDTPRFIRTGESLNQDVVSTGASVWEHTVASSYMDANDGPPEGPGGAGRTRWEIDQGYLTRPEIAVEIEPRLKSRDSEKNEEPEFGIFEKEAIGPTLFEIDTDEVYPKELFTTQGFPESQAYFKNAAHQVKRGTHDTPYSTMGSRIITYWQERFEITSDGQQDVGDTAYPYTKTRDEITVWLNRAKLKLGDKNDYTETTNRKIKLKKDLAKDKDIVWIVRKPYNATGDWAVDKWESWPPGANCHKHYGGNRGDAPTDDFVGHLRKAFSPDPGGSRRPVAGRFDPYPYTNYIDLNPDSVATAADRQRVEAQAVIADGDQKGLAGFLFSPSVIAGDTYKLEATVRGCCYARDPGFVNPAPEKPWSSGRTGTLTVWRLNTISQSWRMPPTGTKGLPGTEGIPDSPMAGRAHPGDGVTMNFVSLLNKNKLAFNEWIIDPQPPDDADTGADMHTNVNLDIYRAFFNGRVAPASGYYNLASNAKVNEYFARWDHYRVKLPPGIPGNRKKLASKKVGQAALGADPQDVANDVDTGISNWNASHANDIGSTSLGAHPLIPISNKTPDRYLSWVDTQVTEMANDFMTQIMTQRHEPPDMRILRWPRLYWDTVWKDGTPGGIDLDDLGTAGYCQGSGQAFFFTVGGNPDTFEHEMGHSLFLAHFAAGGSTNFAWKHHDLNYQSCLMGYYSGDFTVPIAGVPALRIVTGARNHLCPKCLLKTRGWKEIVLPSKWDEGRVF